MKDYHYGDVVWVNLDPSAGHEQGKRRPVVVVSNDAYNRFNNLTMVVPITSSREYPLHVNVGVIPTEDGLAIHGWAEIEQLKSLDLEARYGSVVGELDEETLDKITDMVLVCLMQPTMRIENLVQV